MTYMILSIDGGGIRGAIPARILAWIEQQTGKPVADMFNMITGTSTGGILAAGLACRNQGQVVFAATDLLDFYHRDGKQVFHRDISRQITSLFGLVNERYSAAALEELLLAQFGDLDLTDTGDTSLILTSYDTERRQPFYFKSRQARAGDRGRNFLLRDALRATTAAPTYFEPARLYSIDPVPVIYSLVDGGIFANNPAMSALSEAMSLGVAPGDVHLVSLGTGRVNKPWHYAFLKNRGMAGWVVPLLDMMMDGGCDATDFHLRHILAPHQYWRLDTELEYANDNMDMATAENLHNLDREANKIIDQNRNHLDRLITQLLQPAQSFKR